ncbi:murein biosynthesis integral membrane protein MurJ [Sphingomonadaceae bacterium jetA1]|jgi:putative peptidoglycan lipid II flippase|uniref:murein biosynthesis integral membrane protein MurJ n=1 Tax=Facivitalis istanbulensis TaxID=3075838 RepID=UPI0034962B74
MNLTKALGSVGGLTLASRVLGLVRDSLFFRFVGANFASDAFQIAFRLPNLFRALFAEGAFSAAFIPMFNRKVAEGDKAEGAAEGAGLKQGLAFAEDALSMLLPVLLAMTALVELAAWPVTWVQTFGYGKGTAAQFDYIVLLNRLTFPYLLFISLVSLLGGILNSLQRFWVNAAAPILLNLTLIVALLLFHDHDPLPTARNQAMAVSVAGALQLVWLWWACRRAGVRLRLKRPTINDDVKRLLKLILPAAAGAGAVQINLVISTALAARFLPAGSVSYIYAADRLNQLPLGLIGIGLGTVLLPTVSRLLGAGKEAEAMETQNRGMELALLLTLPATVALIVCGQPIAAALFQHGKFTATNSFYTAQALAAFSIGLPSYILVKVLTPGFYARADTRTPVRFATWSMLVNLGLNLAFILPLRHMGPPLATAIASTVNVALLYHTLSRRGHFVADAQLRRRAWRIALAALLMGGAMAMLNTRFQPYVTGSNLERWGALILLVATGMLVYALATFATGAFRIGDIKRLVRRSN